MGGPPIRLHSLPFSFMSQSSVSVIIPAYRAAGTICRAIDSILAQTVPADEIIVVDDGSPDDQVELIKRYGPPVILVQRANGKAAAARNTGIERASGELVAFLDADDYWEPKKLQRQLAVLQQYPDVAIVGSRYYCQQPNQDRQINLTAGRRLYDRVLKQSGTGAFQLGTMLWTGTVLMRRSALADQRFSSGLEPAEDRDLWIRMVAQNPTFLLSEPLATAVLEPGGISRSSIERDCRMMLEVVDRHRHLLHPFARSSWRAFVRYRWATMESATHRALPMLLRSIVGWPAPFIGVPCRRPLGRTRRLAYLLKDAAWGVRMPGKGRAAV